MGEDESEFLIGMAEIAGTLIGAWLVGLFFYLDLDARRGEFRGASHRYIRAGTRGVFALFAIPLLMPLVLITQQPVWGAVLFAALSVILIGTTYSTIRLVMARKSSTQSFAILLNEWAGNVAIIALVVLPWVRGGSSPLAADFIPSLVIALGAGFANTVTFVMAEFDAKRGVDPGSRRTARSGEPDTAAEP